MKIRNIVLTALHTLRAHAFGVRVPVNAMLSVTNRCPSRCRYCGIPDRQQRELTTRETFQLIDQLHRRGCQRLGLWGGEPLEREDIVDIAAYAKARGLFVTIDSNGWYLPQKKEILDHIDHLMLSFDGPRDMHERNRCPGSFDRVMEAIETAAGNIPLWTITVLTKHNLDAVDFILAAARRYGFLATFQVLHHNDRLGRNREDLLPRAEDYRNVLRKLAEEKKKGAPIATTVQCLERLQRWPDYRVPVMGRGTDRLACWAGKLFCNIDTDGTVYPCSLLIDTIKAQNFLDVGFAKAFDFLATQEHCAACSASCFTEYNYLYSLDVSAISSWMAAFRRTGKLCRPG